MLIYRVLGMKYWLEKQNLALAGWAENFESVKTSASFKNTELVTMCPMCLHVSINFKKERIRSLGLKSFHSYPSIR